MTAGQGKLHNERVSPFAFSISIYQDNRLKEENIDEARIKEVRNT